MSARKTDPTAAPSQAAAADERQRQLPAIPAGIEAVLGMAALNPDFALALRRDRVAAVVATGVELTATENRILAAVDDGALAAMIGNVGDSVPNRDRRAFLSRSAAALLVLAAGGLGSGCGRDGDKPKSKPRSPPPDAAPLPADAAPPPADATSAAGDSGLGGLHFEGPGPGGSGTVVPGRMGGTGKYPAITGITPKRPREPRRPKERVNRGVSRDLRDKPDIE